MTSESSGRMINWRQAFAEVALIFVGILVALAVDSWWTQRSERIEARNYLEALLQDFRDSHQTLIEEVEVHTDIIFETDEVLTVLKSGLDEGSGESFLRAVSGLYPFEFWTPITGTYDDLVSSGRLLLIENEEIRKELSGFQRVLANIQESEELQSRNYYERQSVFLNKHSDNSFGVWPLNNYQPPQSPYGSNLEAFDTREFWNLVEDWKWVHVDIILAYRDAIIASDSIVSLIEQELGK